MTARNRIIYLQEPVAARDNFGGSAITWTTLVADQPSDQALDQGGQVRLELS